jgi:hypothetical protein
MKFKTIKVSIEDILIDPNNYRFHDLKGWKAVKEDRFQEEKIQDNTKRLLRSTPSFELNLLKDSIRTNGFVPLEQLVVKPYAPDTSKYVVVEGNRRISALQWLLEDEGNALITLDKATVESMSKLSVLLLDMSVAENNNAVDILMAIRHVSGVKEWGAYQQAKLITQLMAEEGMTFRTVSEMLGMSSREVARRYRASKALQQMEIDEEFGDYAAPNMYMIFHETVAQPTIREWLGWSNDKAIFENSTNLSDFYSLISDTEEQEAKIKGFQDIRTKVKRIIESRQALKIMLDPDKSLDEAYQVAIEEEGLHTSFENFEVRIVTTIDLLDGLPANVVRNLTDVQKQNLLDLKKRIDRTLNDNRALSASKEK